MRYSRMLTLSVLLSLTVVAARGNLRSRRKLIRARNNQDRIDEQYIIRFKDSVADVDTKVETLMRSIPGGTILYKYDNNLKGAAVEHLPETMLSAILDDDEIEFVEEDQIVRASSNVQSNPPWGLDRIDSTSSILDKKYRYSYTGKGVRVFVVDSGIRSTHRDFGGRVTCGMSVFPGSDCEDGQGHGTHVAGTVGGTKYGVAKDVELVAVRMLDQNGEGSISGVVLGLDYIRQQKNANPAIPMIANLSLSSGGSSPSVDAAIESAVAAGVVVVVAAGNDSRNACFAFLATAKNAIAVGATDGRDSLTSFSNYGSCVDIFAPGQNVPSAWFTSNTAESLSSGTSMAAPHVAGVAAMYLQANPHWSPQQVWEAIRDDASYNVVQNAGADSPNRMVNTAKLNQRATNNNEFRPGNPGSSTYTDNSQCKRVFGSCRQNSDCCSGSCTLRLCFMF